MGLVSCQDDVIHDPMSSHARFGIQILDAAGDTTRATVRSEASAVGIPAVTQSTHFGHTEFVLPEGAYTFFLIGIGYVTETSATPDREDAFVFSLSAGDKVEHEIQLAGLLVDLVDASTGEAIPWDPDFVERVDLLPNTVWANHTVRDDDGRLRFPNLPAFDSLRVGVEPSEEPFLTTWFPDALVAEDAEPLSTEPGVVKPVTVRVHRGGYLRLEWETPLPYKYLLASSFTVDSPIEIRNSSFGNVLQVGPLPVGIPVQPSVQVSWKDHEEDFSGGISSWRLPTFVPSADSTQTRRIKLHGLHIAAQTANLLEVSMRAESSFDGDDLISYHRGGADAWLLFPSVGPREVRLSGSPSDSRISSWWPGVADESQSEPLVLQLDETRDLQFPLLRGAYLRGLVLDSSGQRLPQSVTEHLELEIPGESERDRNFQVEANGVFSVDDLPAGSYTLAAIPAEGSAFEMTWWGDTTEPTQAQVLEVEFGDKRHDLEIRLQRK